MNIEQLKKNIGWHFQLRPAAIGLSAMPAWWFLVRIDDHTRLAEFRHATGHVLLLGGDHIRSFMSDPNRDTAARRHGFLTLDVQVTVQGSEVLIEPIPRQAPSRQRSVSPAVRNQLVERLRRTPARIACASVHGDIEAHHFKELLIAIFREARWEVDDAQTFVFFGARTGLVLTIPLGAPETTALRTVAEALALTGNAVAVNRGDMATKVGMYLQVWHAPQP